MTTQPNRPVSGDERDLVAFLRIRGVDDPVLHRGARRLTKKEIRSRRIQDLIEMMRATMQDVDGVGLAAPQVGMPFQLVVIELPERLLAKVTPDQRAAEEREIIPFYVLVNPELTVEAEPTRAFPEGCLSLPGFKALVARGYAVHGNALDHRGEPIDIQRRAWHARILQHEVDHLKGVLFIDKMEPGTLKSLQEIPRHVKTWLEHLEAEACHLCSRPSTGVSTVLGPEAAQRWLTEYGDALLQEAGIEEAGRRAVIERTVSDFLQGQRTQARSP